MMEFSERVRLADVREALTAFFEKRLPHFNTGRNCMAKSFRSLNELTCSHQMLESQSQVGAEAK
jgi:hypothetical protein